MGYIDSDLIFSILAPLEVFRRFIWNYFRLENEHLNNCGNFRAVRDIVRWVERLEGNFHSFFYLNSLLHPFPARVMKRWSLKWWTRRMESPTGGRRKSARKRNTACCSMEWPSRKMTLTCPELRQILSLPITNRVAYVDKWGHFFKIEFRDELIYRKNWFLKNAKINFSTAKNPCNSKFLAIMKFQEFF